MSGVNPQGVDVVSFKQPSSEELDHDFRYLLGRGVRASGRGATRTYVIPADHKKVMQAMLAALLVDTIGSPDLRWPEVSEQARSANAEARRKLATEAEDETG